MQPVLTFGEEIMICASDTVNKKREIVQNKALRFITGGVKTCPILAMQMYSGIKSLKISKEQAAMKMYERIIRIPNNLWRNYKPAENRKQKFPTTSLNISNINPSTKNGRT